MEYTVNALAKLAGVSTRTLRYYDKCGLLPPKAIRANGYRVYGEAEVDRLQQILFYRELGVELAEIGRILSAQDFESLAALHRHHTALLAKRARLDALIANVKKTIGAMKGENEMSNSEKFEGFKQALVAENEKKFGDEIRKKYGDEAIEKSNAKMLNMTQAQYDDFKALEQELSDTLKAATAQGDPADALAQRACELHKRWLCCTWTQYSKEAHMGVAQMYVDDPRFTAYYEAIAPGCAEFLRDAVRVFCA